MGILKGKIFPNSSNSLDLIEEDFNYIYKKMVCSLSLTYDFVFALINKKTFIQQNPAICWQ